MNWKRGMLGLWLLSSVLWAAAVLAIAVGSETARRTTVHVKFSNTETWDYPVEWGEERIRADLEARIAVKAAEERKWVADFPEDRKAACRDWPTRSPLTEQPEDCAKFFVATNSELAVPTGWEEQLPHPVWTMALLLWALGPPAAVFFLGAAMIWVGYGFRPGP